MANYHGEFFTYRDHFVSLFQEKSIFQHKKSSKSQITTPKPKLTYSTFLKGVPNFHKDAFLERAIDGFLLEVLGESELTEHLLIDNKHVVKKIPEMVSDRLKNDLQGLLKNTYKIHAKWLNNT